VIEIASFISARGAGATWLRSESSFGEAAMTTIQGVGTLLLLAGILALSMAGLTVNIVVLFTLILAIGELVDNAIIVTEYAERRNLVWPIVLIVLGLLFLAYNLGYLKFSELKDIVGTWWPLILIALGIVGLAQQRK
jgi:hypothetical protein